MRIATFFTLLFWAAVAAGADKLSMDVKDHGVALSGASGDIVWFGVANEPVNGASRIMVREGVLLRENDAGAALTIELPGGVAPRSLWAAVDLRTAAIASTASKLLKLKTKPISDIVEETDGDGSELHIKAEWIELLVVRPDEGAWRYTASDGGQGDEDGTSNGTITIHSDKGQPVPGPSITAAPTNLQPGDVLVVIDVPTMTICGIRH